MRELANLDSTVETLAEVPASVQIEEGGLRFEVPLGEGQKSGWFFEQRLNRQALQLLAPGGFLISSSCPMHLAAERLLQLLLKAAHDSGRRLQVLQRGFQGVDHPVRPCRKRLV